MRTSRGRAVLAAAALVLAGSVTACGGDDSDGAQDEATASDTPASEGDAAEEPSDGDDAEEPSEGDDQPADGGADLTQANFATTLVSAQSEADTVHLTGSFGSGQQALAMDGDMETGDPDDLAMDVQLEVPQLGSDVRMILLDQTVYMNLGQPTGNKYAEIDLSDPSDPLGQQFGPLLDTADPGRSIAALDEGMQTLDKVGGEELDGVATTQYRAVVDTEKALAASGVSENMPPEAAAQLPKTLTYDVWVGDDDGLIRKMTFDLLGQTSELTFSDWGEDVEIEAPPANQITKGGAGLG